MNLSIITACIPLMKPFLRKLRFGLIDPSIPIRSGHYALHSYPKSSSTGIKKHLGQDSKMNEINTNIEAGSHIVSNNNLDFPDDSIHQTREFRVDVDVDSDSQKSVIGFHI